MMKKLVLVAALSLASANLASAGDTVTINMPGGATQTVSASVLAAAISRAGLAIGVSDQTGSSVIASVTQNAATGDITVTTTGGKSYTVSSRFIATLLVYYG